MAAGVWAVVIVVFGVVPTQQVISAAAPDHQVASTLAGHFVEYAILAGLVAAAAHDRYGRKRGAILALTFAVSLGVAIELVQAILPYRDCQAVDVLVNTVAAVCGLALFSVVSTARGRRRSRRA